MGLVQYNQYCLTINEIWYDSRTEQQITKCDLALYLGMQQPPRDYGTTIYIREKETLITDLTRSENDLLQEIKASTRYKIRRAEADNFVYRVYDSQALRENPLLLEDYVKTYNQFIKTKGLSRRLRTSVTRLKSYLDKDMLVITMAMQNEKAFIYHLYLTEGKIVRLHHNVSLFRNMNNNVMKALLGRANRSLLFHDLLMFKAAGYEEYDWGGYSKLSALKSVNRFKEEFGGVRIQVYHYAVPHSFFGKVVVFAYNIFEALKKSEVISIGSRRI